MQEIQRSGQEYYLVFLYGKTSTNWAQFFDIAVVGNNIIENLREHDYDTLRYAGIGTIAHELSHLFGGLADVISDNGNLMSYFGDKMDYFSYNLKDFPNVNFTTEERGVLRRHLN
ncbi:MAG: hypothetical protein ABIG29_03630 [Candidatus Nealsonbacteria bacterium]